MEFCPHRIKSLVEIRVKKQKLMKLSIVIPIYNVERYIEKCLKSCVNQDIELGKDYEIICVNDGTMDKSADIARQIASDHAGVTVIDQENQGLSVARNTGLKYAKGDYVWFVDSDDYIADNCLGGIVRELMSNNVDMMCVQQFFSYEDGRQPVPQRRILVRSGSTGMDVFKRGKYNTMAQLSIYRRSMLIEHNLNFYPGIYHEDAEFMPRALYYTKTIASYDKYVYYYLQRTSGSITSNYKLKNGLDALKVCNSLMEFSERIESKFVGAYATRVAQIVSYHLRHYKFLKKEEQLVMLDAMEKDKNIFSYMQKASSMKGVIAGWILSVNLVFGVKAFSCR